MAPRPIASATISFGLVSVPIQLDAASESSATISFNWLHKKCGSRLKQQYVCPQDGEKVERDDMIKGYEFGKGQYVQFAPEELKALEEKSTGSIDVREFVPGAEIDRIYLDRTYFLGPDKGGDRAYRLLAQALQTTGRAAVGQYAARGKQYVISIRPVNGVLVMEQLHYADEVRSAKEVPLGEGEVKEAELKLAIQLIEQGATEEFHPEAYQDNVRQRMLEEIQKKVDGQQISTEPEQVPQTQIIDLMEALKASLARGPKEAPAERKPVKRAQKATALKEAKEPKKKRKSA
ncbi:MAG: Ku protein [Gemmatimonadetes bacterium]|nr:Ku protein [Gemmatimonadota bacterium]